jgi:hypothetical protein
MVMMKTKNEILEELRRHKEMLGSAHHLKLVCEVWGVVPFSEDVLEEIENCHRNLLKQLREVKNGR